MENKHSNKIQNKELALANVKYNVWKDIAGFNNYEVNPYVGIRNKKTQRVLKPRTWMGYPRVTLMSNCKKHEIKIHRVVATHFINNPDPNRLNIVNHKNGNRSDFRIENLEWVTQSDNIKDRWLNRGKRPIYTPEYTFKNRKIKLK